MDYIVKKRDGWYVVYMRSTYVASFETFEEARGFIQRKQETSAKELVGAH